MTISYSQSKAGRQTSGATLSETFTNSVTAGNSIVVFGYGSSDLTVSDTVNSYSQQVKAQTTSGTYIFCWVANNVAAASANTLAVQISGTTCNNLIISEYTCPSPASVDSVQHGTENAGSSASISYTQATVAAHTTIIAGGFGNDASTPTVGSGFNAARQATAASGSLQAYILEDVAETTSGNKTVAATICSSTAGAAAGGLASVALYIGPISGTSAAVFSASGTLLGAGVLSGSSAAVSVASGTIIGTSYGSSAAVFSASGSLLGSGVLAGSSAAVFVTSGAMVAAISGASAAVFLASGTLLGTGVMAGESDAAFISSGNLLGSGVLAGASSAVFVSSGSLLGVGALSGASACAFSTSGTLLGVGELGGASTSVFVSIGTLLGSGSLSGASSAVFATSGSLQGLGALAGLSAPAFAAYGTMLGAGVLSGSSVAVFVSSGTLRGFFSLDGTSAVVFVVSGTMMNLSPLRIISGYEHFIPIVADDALFVPAGPGDMPEPIIQVSDQKYLRIISGYMLAPVILPGDEP